MTVLMSNIRNGLSFEMGFCKKLGQHGFWVHRVTPNAAGQQPCDVIAIKDHKHFLIDCKLLTAQHGAFRFSRVEDNQRDSMRMFRQRGGADGWFAIGTMDNRVRMLSLNTIEHLEKVGKPSIPEKELDEWCIPLEEWLESCEKL